MPHWINLSFYSTNKKIAYSNFIPRIKLPPTQENSKDKDASKTKQLLAEDEYIHNSFFDYDAYDAQVFQLPVVHGTGYNYIFTVYNLKFLINFFRTRQRTSVRYKSMYGSLLDPQEQLKSQRKLSDPDIRHSSNSPTRSQAITIPAASTSPIASPNSGNSDGK